MIIMMYRILEELCSLDAVSGNENEVREYIIEKLKKTDVKIETDNVGNLHVFKKGRSEPKNKVMVAAHMDEVGFIVNHIDKDGYISIMAVGGILDKVLMGRKIRFESGVIGIIGGTPIHLLTTEQRNEQPKLEKLSVDIGATSYEEALKNVSLGDYAYFISEYLEFGEEKIKGKALDDRIGCAIMLDMLLNGDLEYDNHFVFTAMEEIGLRGAGVASYIEKPDFALVLEATTAADIPDVSGEKRVCELGKGTVVSYMDRSTVYDKELYRLMFDIAEKNNLKCQTKTMVAGGNDSGIIHKTAGGIRTIALSVPCRYLHSPSCVIDKRDLNEMRVLAEKALEEIAIL